MKEQPIQDLCEIFREIEDEAIKKAQETDEEWMAQAQRRRVRSILEMRRLRRNGCIESARDEEE